VERIPAKMPARGVGPDWARLWAGFAAPPSRARRETTYIRRVAEERWVVQFGHSWPRHFADRTEAIRYGRDLAASEGASYVIIDRYAARGR
jgi:hypothetical protein